MPTINYLQSNGIGAILDYAAEADVIEEDGGSGNDGDSGPGGSVVPSSVSATLPTPHHRQLLRPRLPPPPPTPPPPLPPPPSPPLLSLLHLLLVLKGGALTDWELTVQGCTIILLNCSATRMQKSLRMRSERCTT